MVVRAEPCKQNREELSWLLESKEQTKVLLVFSVKKDNCAPSRYHMCVQFGSALWFCTVLQCKAIQLLKSESLLMLAVKRRLRKWLRALHTLCTLHCYCAVRQCCSAKLRRVESLADEPPLRSIMERQGGRTTIVDELESNLRAKLHMDGLIKSTTTKTW